MIGLDTETYLIRPGLLAPKLVCTSAFDGETERLFLREQGLRVFRRLLETETPITAHNAAYDMGVKAAEDPTLLPLIFEAYEKGLIRCTLVRQQLIDIATGKLKKYKSRNLQSLVKRYTGRFLEKQDTFRLRYHELDGIPLEDWPAAASEYAKKDAVEHLRVFEAQEAFMEKEGITLPDEILQTKCAFVLHLMSVHGIRTDKEAVTKWKASVVEKIEAQQKILLEAGIIHENPKTKSGWSRNMKLIYERVLKAGGELKIEIPKTTTGKPSTERDLLEELAPADSVLETLAEYSGTLKNLTTHVPILEQGVNVPINARYNVLVETGRTSCSDPPMQQPPRKGGFRECFIPRPGYVFCSVDYDTIELRSLAQVCLWLFGESQMAFLLQQGRDLHVAMAAELLGISYELAEAKYQQGDLEVSDMRQFAKIPNFGLPGGLGAKTLVAFAKGYGVEITEDRAKEVKNIWLKTFREMKKYFDHMGELVRKAFDDPSIAKMTQFQSRRVRGDVTFCAACNGNFQGLTADGAKDAHYYVAKECYTVPESPLYGSRPVIFLHDEIVSEVPEAKAHEAAARQTQIMVEVMQRWIPDIPITAEPALSRRWYKGAKPVYENGRLVPWEPKEKS